MLRILRISYFLLASQYLNLHILTVIISIGTLGVGLHLDCTRGAYISTRYLSIFAHSLLYSARRRCSARRTIINRSTLASGPSVAASAALSLPSRTTATAVASAGGRAAVCSRCRSAADEQGVGYAL